MTITLFSSKRIVARPNESQREPLKVIELTASAEV